MTKHEAAVVGTYTGILVGSFADMQNYAEKLMGRPVWTHEFASADFANALREKAKPDFMALEVSDDTHS